MFLSFLPVVEMSKSRKVSLSLDAALVSNLDYLSARLSVSRSALVTQLLLDGVAHMRRLIEVIPPNPTPADLVRMRGESVEEVRARIQNLQALENDLFSE